MPKWAEELIAIVGLLAVVGVVLARLPRADVGHTDEYRRRRALNWLIVGLAYAFLYMGRYNLTAYKNAVKMSHDAYGTIDQWGSLVYGLSFLLNGPLADRLGGRMTLGFAVFGSAFANLYMGFLVRDGWTDDKLDSFVVAACVNQYFQSFGAVSIVKVNAAWFHLRERGTFGGIFGILISLGLYFAYDWNRVIAERWGPTPVFQVAPALLLGMGVLIALFVRDTPGQAGHRDFDTGDAGSMFEGQRQSVWRIAWLMATNPAVLIITAIEFCSGFLRNGIMKWFQVYAKGVGQADTFVSEHWGMVICCAGILGGVFAGTISDHLFQSRRGPVSAVLYAGMIAACLAMIPLLGGPLLGWAAVFGMLCIIGVHGMLSGTASMDFGGKKNVGVVVGIIDGFVYFGSASQAFILKKVLPDGDAAKDPASWSNWPLALLPAAVLGLLLSTRVWNARADKRGGGH